jgi:hypothetical protein
MLPEDLPFKVVRINSHDEVLARAADPDRRPRGLRDGHQALSQDTIQYRNGAQIIARSDVGKAHE